MAGNVTIAAAAKASKAAAVTLAKKLRQQRNQEAAVHFGIGIAGLIFLVSLIFWTRTFHKRLEETNKSRTREILIKITRYLRKRLLQKVPGFTSAGHAIIFIIYLIICLSVLFTNINWTNLSGFAKRLGWLTVLNFSLTIFLSLKNTPLAILANQSHEKLNGLHQIAGYSTVVCYLLHAIIYMINIYNLNKFDVLREKAIILGMASGFFFIIIFFTAIFLRKHQYELFYAIHIIMAALALITAILHRPNLIKTKSSYILIFAGAIWGLDRLLRVVNLCIFSNTATITPLPHGGVRIVLSRAPKSAVPGNHLFVWLPAIRAFETHPFTCISTTPMEFIVSAHGGFTRDLHDRAMREPGAVFRASVHGPYGSVPDFSVFDRIVFIAGGSGASYTCALATDLLRKIGPSRNITIDFTLVLKNKELIEWTSTYLNILAASSIVNLRIHITSSTADTSFVYTPEAFHFGSFSANHKHQKFVDPLKINCISPLGYEFEKSTLSSINSPISAPIILFPGRPDMNAIISDNVEITLPEQRIAVAACGPDSMMLAVRKAVTENIRPHGPALELFSEHFSW
ncbi:hypothetical protein K3495_g6187 [Podosphaera aphanis]|nr:hypothetical protein K3495_g6187 [Podosphaera aphanis]